MANEIQTVQQAINQHIAFNTTGFKWSHKGFNRWIENGKINGLHNVSGFIETNRDVIGGWRLIP